MPDKTPRLTRPGGSAAGRARLHDSPGERVRASLRVVYRRRFLAASVFALVVLAAAAYTLTRVPVYEAQAQVLIEFQDPQIVNFEEVLDEGRGADYYQTQYTLLRSRSLARRTLQALDLWTHPLFSGAGGASVADGAAPVADAVETAGGRPRAAGAVVARDAVAVSQFGGGSPLDVQGQAEPPSQATAVATLLRDLQIVPVRSTRLVNIRFLSPDPKLAADVVNTHAREFIEQNLEFRVQASDDATEWLSERLEQQQRRVEESEAALQRFREEHNAVSLDAGQNIVAQELGALSAAATRAKTRRLEIEARYRQLTSLQSDRLETFPVIMGNELIQRLKVDLAALQREHAQLSETLGARHPNLSQVSSAIVTTEARIQTEIASIVESLRNELRSAVAEEASLQQALDNQKQAVLAQNVLGIEYGVLSREAESVRHIYEGLLQRAKETGLSRELRATNIRIVDTAEPPRSPSSPRPVANMLLAVLLGLTLAAGAAFGAEIMDERLKTPEDVTSALRVPFLGLIPRLGRQPAGVYLATHTDSEESEPAVEAFRALRSTLLYSSGGAPPDRSIVVASTARGEGKTLVACNLAVALAKAHRHVLLIDGDMRDPGVHLAFGESLEPGLSDVLAQGADFDRVLRKTSTEGLQLITAGSAVTDPTERLGSPAFQKLVTAAAGRFHYIVIDSPPILAVADAAVAAHAAAAVLFIVRADKTGRRAARLAIDQLRCTGGRVVGAVLNGAELRRHPFYYAPYVRSEYGGRPDASRRIGRSIS